MKMKLFVSLGVLILVAGGVRAQEKEIDKEEMPILKAKSGDEMESLYIEWLKKYPPEQHRDDSLRYDFVRMTIGREFAKEKNRDKARLYADQLLMEFWKGNGYIAVAMAFYQSGDTVDAVDYMKRGFASAELFINGKRGNDNKAQFAASGYGPLARECAKALYEEKKYDEALVYIQKDFAYEPKMRPDVNALYGKILMGLGRDQEAFDKLEAVLKAGQSTPELEADLRSVYVRLKGSDKGYDDYLVMKHREGLAELRERLSREMINEQAADFTLTDVDGQVVRLSDLKGKVVVLDFWATWCGPCKGSFPAMQMAVDKYKNDPDVQFLFIHTFEREEHATALAKHYVDSMRYSFRVLMDLKDPATKLNTVGASYKVTAIPAKFVIDREGRIRFKLTGFDGNKEAAAEEVGVMVELAKKSLS